MSNRFDQQTLAVTINGANLKISGATLRNMALEQLHTYPQCVAFIGQLVNIAKQLTLSGNEEAINALFQQWKGLCMHGGYVSKAGKPSDEMAEAITTINANETIIVFYKALKAHSRYVDVLFILSASVTRQRIYALLNSNDPFSSDPWVEFYSALNKAQLVSKELAMAFMNRGGIASTPEAF